MQRCLLSVLYPARKPVTTLDWVLLNNNNLVLAARLGVWINPRASLCYYRVSRAHMGMTGITALVLSAVMMMMTVVMIIKINCNDKKINKLAAQAALVGCKEHCIEIPGYVNCGKRLDYPANS